MALRGSGINKIQFTRQILAGRGISNNKKLKALTENQALAVTKEKTKEYIAEFINHPITKDIKAGPRSEDGNSAGCLGSSRGNLYSFIGFDSDPIDTIKQEIENACRLRRTSFKAVGKRSVGSNVTWDIQWQMSYPTVEDLKRLPEADLPRQPGSWIDKIEKNITGLGYYFYAKRGFDQSQSGNAIQLDKKFQSGRFKRKSYFTGIIKKVFGRITFA